VLYRRPELEASALVAAFIASAIGYATFTSFTGFGGFLLADADRLAFGSALELPVHVLVGIACGLASIVLARLVEGTEAVLAGVRCRSGCARRSAVGRRGSSPARSRR